MVFKAITAFFRAIAATKAFKAIKIIGTIVTLAVGVKRFFTSKTDVGKRSGHTCKQNICWW